MNVWIAENIALIAKLFTLKTRTLECYQLVLRSDVFQITLERSANDMERATTLAMF